MLIFRHDIGNTSFKLEMNFNLFDEAPIDL
jgi:hypothetical protein